MSDTPADRVQREATPPNRRRDEEEPQGLGARLRDWFADQRGRAGLRRPEGKKPPRNEVQAHAWYWIAAFIGLMLFQSWWVTHQSIEPVPYSRFLEMLRDHKLTSVQVEDQRLLGTLKEKLPNGRSYVSSIVVPGEVQKALQAAGVEYTGVLPNMFWSTLFSWLIPIGIFLVFWFFVFRRLAHNLGGEGGLMAIGRSRAKIFVETDTKTTFADVAGAEEAKEELQEIVRVPARSRDAMAGSARTCRRACCWWARPAPARRCSRARWRARRGCRSSRSPARSSWRCSWASGAARVRDLFQQASEKAPAIVFIDELDALGARAAPSAMGGVDEKEQTLNQLLVELDGFDPRSGVVLLAATNRPEILDPALLRAGRFDRQVLVDRPDKAARTAIVALHLRKVRLAPGVDPEKIAELTPGLTGADLANVVNEAALLATRRGAAAGGSVRLQRGDRAHASRACSRRTRVLAPRERETWRITRWVTRWWRWRCRAPTASTRSRSFRAASVRSATRSSGRPRTAS